MNEDEMRYLLLPFRYRPAFGEEVETISLDPFFVPIRHCFGLVLDERLQDVRASVKS